MIVVSTGHAYGSLNKVNSIVQILQPCHLFACVAIIAKLQLIGCSTIRHFQICPTIYKSDE